jgi:pimeloyl-ACP methyl ester carboxylesterase
MVDPGMKRTVGDGVKIALAVWEGKGKTVLCVHGIAASCRCWDIVIDALAPDHSVLAIDLRGRGLSDKPASGYSIMHHCEDISALLKDQGIERVVIIGHSLGALIGLAFAAQFPERVDRLILVDGGGKLTKEQSDKVFASIQPTLDRLGKVFPSEEAYLDMMKANPLLQPWTPELETYYRYELEETEGGVCSRVKPEHIKEEADNLAGFDVAEFYPQVDCSVLILRATENMFTLGDLLLPEKALERMVNEIPDARYINLEGTNHYSILLQPNTLRNDAIRSFLNE